jgi:hypothetical protein
MLGTLPHVTRRAKKLEIARLVFTAQGEGVNMI